MPFELPELPYPYDALEEAIDAQTMEIHHGKHHVAYVTNLNKALENSPELMEMPIEAILAELEMVPEESRMAVRNNGGGHYNHSLFWQMLAPSGKPMSTDLEAKITEDLGSVDSMKEQMIKAGLSRFGSGWAWLVSDMDKLAVVSTPNQDNPIMEGKIPLLGIDVWEHAYYLRYKNMRADYLEAIFKIINWEFVETLLKGEADA